MIYFPFLDVPFGCLSNLYPVRLSLLLLPQAFHSLLPSFEHIEKSYFIFCTPWFQYLKSFRSRSAACFYQFLFTVPFSLWFFIMSLYSPGNLTCWNPLRLGLRVYVFREGLLLLLWGIGPLAMRNPFHLILSLGSFGARGLVKSGLRPVWQLAGIHTISG